MAEVLQVLKATSAQPRGLFYADGALVDLDAAVPVVTLTKPDGTAGPASGTVTRITTGTYAFTLTAASTAELTVYSVNWTGNVGGLAQTITTSVEVVGDYLFTLAALRAVKVGGTAAFTDTTAYPAQLLIDRRAEVTDDFAARCGWSFTPRFARETRDGDGSGCVVLGHLKASKLLSVTVGGTARSLTGYSLRPSGVLEAVSGYQPVGFFTPGRQNIVVEYVHGDDIPPPAVSTAALARAAMLLLPGQGSTVSSWTTPDGTTYSYDQAGQRFAGGGTRHYGVPAIDSVLNDPAYSAGALAVA